MSDFFSSQRIWLLWMLTVRELKGRYKSSILGFLWAIINPLFQMIVLTIVFSLILKVQIENYPLFLFSGLLPWTYFATTLMIGTSSLTSNRDIIKKVAFPRELIPFSVVLANLVHFTLALIPFLIILIFLGLAPQKSIIFLPLAILLETTLLTGLILLTSSLQILYRDISFIVVAALLMLFYLTPVFYPLSFVPERLQLIYSLNPMVGVTNFFQYIFLGSEIYLEGIVISLLESIIFFLFGFNIFKARSLFFSDWV
ncbi:hypothetical protein A3E15_01200 [Candidatus Woesebacteria bacterium RIFCSPHIGHO2_12_FULL_42_9]|uniref:Transport permease protein n=3 Tax=Candidatus Woeseibacteriota TaxID=1752722 RepID=A0A1F8AS05_9BACT|nr:MAG: O-antigen export system permease protein [Candidatus Woesebacteria bacterium GW2011_GWA1_39_12]OGM06702.1 MAG: hypothetical protein A2129_01430 [Candidatus Woesebacteria bacterium GWC1_42_13]OGM54533.1 MAG: hypothetical protein A3E15_01200 [Candidatus Woesebacteria bacterium RIFCSPHIGHO2_12_FULL_42_9]